MQILNWILGKTSAVGRLIIFSALGGVLVAAMVVPIVAATGIVVRNTADKFSTIAVDSDSLAQRSAIYDREGHLISYVWNVDLGAGMTYANGIDRQPVTYDQISPNMLTAIVAIEDDRFWQHGALDVKGTLRALVNDVEHKPIQGGSTLEQQYVKNVLVLQDLDNPVAQQADTADNLSRKLDQLRMAVEVAHTMTKQQILAGVPERLLLRQRRLGHRGGGRDVLQHHRRQAHHDPGGHAGRHRGEPDCRTIRSTTRSTP